MQSQFIYLFDNRTDIKSTTKQFAQENICWTFPNCQLRLYTDAMSPMHPSFSLRSSFMCPLLYFPARPASSSPCEEFSLHINYCFLCGRITIEIIITDTYIIDQADVRNGRLLSLLYHILDWLLTSTNRSTTTLRIAKKNTSARKLAILELKPMVNHKLATLETSFWFFQA